MNFKICYGEPENKFRSRIDIEFFELAEFTGGLQFSSSFDLYSGNKTKNINDTFTNSGSFFCTPDPHPGHFCCTISHLY